MEIRAGIYSSSSTSNESVIDTRSLPFGGELYFGLWDGSDGCDGLSAEGVVSLEVNERNIAGSSGAFKMSVGCLCSGRTSIKIFLQGFAQTYPEERDLGVAGASGTCDRVELGGTNVSSLPIPLVLEIETWRLRLKRLRDSFPIDFAALAKFLDLLLFRLGLRAEGSGVIRPKGASLGAGFEEAGPGGPVTRKKRERARVLV